MTSLKRNSLIVIAVLALSGCRTTQDFCLKYDPVPTLTCQNKTEYKVPGFDEEEYVHCSEEQEVTVDGNNAVYYEQCR